MSHGRRWRGERRGFKVATVGQGQRWATTATHHELTLRSKVPRRRTITHKCERVVASLVIKVDATSKDADNENVAPKMRATSFFAAAPSCRVWLAFGIVVGRNVRLWSSSVAIGRDVRLEGRGVHRRWRDDGRRNGTSRRNWDRRRWRNAIASLQARTIIEDVKVPDSLRQLSFAIQFSEGWKGASVATVGLHIIT